MAGPYYVRSTDGNDADDGLTWATAKATVTGASGALSLAAAGERIWVSQAHAETTAGSISLASAGTSAAPVEIFCGNDAAEPPTSKTTGASISTTGTANISFTGHAAVHGTRFNGGDSTGTSLLNFTSLNSLWWKFEQCVLAIRGSNAAGRIVAGSTGTGTDSKVLLIDTDVQFANAAHAINPNCPFEWRGGEILLGTVPTGGLFKPASGTTPHTVVRGVDLSNIGSNELVSYATATMGGTITFENCEVAAGTVPTAGTAPGPGHLSVIFDNCTSADFHLNASRTHYEGVLTTVDTTFRNGGALHISGSEFSWQMDAGTGATFHHPFYSPELIKPCLPAQVGVSTILTVEILHDSATNLQDDEVWIEVEYPGTSGGVQSVFTSDRMADELATPADQAASSATWTESMSNDNEQALSVTVTPQEVGFFRVRVAVAKDYTLYVDPVVTVT
jgi:hypothetical protein